MDDELIDNYSQDIHFVIGYAGTGKSSRLANDTDHSTIVLTPTHKAKEVLIDKGLENVFTIHSVLKLVPTIDENFRTRGSLQKLRRIGDVDLKHISHIVIDEYSMISTRILDLLLEVLPAKAKVTIYGDSGQLPPVDGDPIDPYFYTAEEKIETLTKQYRAEAPEVVKAFTKFAQFIETGDSRIDLRLVFGGSLRRGDISSFNPDTDRILAYTNDRVIELNNMVAQKLNLPREISIGETVLVNGLVGRVVKEPDEPILRIYPKCVAKGQLMSGDKLIDTIEKVEDDIDTYNQKLHYAEPFYVDIEDTVYELRCDIEHYKHSKSFKQTVENAQLELIHEYNLGNDIDLKQYCRTHNNSHTKARGRAWSDFLGHQSLVWDIRRPYATTVHKSQGSEFAKVFIDQEDIKKAIRGNYYEAYSRLMYVSLSRAIKEVIIL
jgi:ATP-dependent exoDNAse (exonuclease V) alpha subunit